MHRFRLEIEAGRVSSRAETAAYWLKELVVLLQPTPQHHSLVALRAC